MLNENDLEIYLNDHDLKDAAKDYIRTSFNSDPSRLVGDRTNYNVCTYLASDKMGHSVPLESHLETYYARICEYNSDIINFLTQPPPVSVIRTMKNGTRRSGSYFPDFLVLSKRSPFIVEIKSKEDLEKNIVANPYDWKFINNEYVYIPGKKSLEIIGLEYKVVSSDQFNPIECENIKLLLEARRKNNLVTKNIIRKVLKLLTRDVIKNIDSISVDLKDEDLTLVLQLIDKNILYADVKNQLLSNPYSTFLSLNKELYAFGMSLCDAETKLFDFRGAGGSIDCRYVPSKKEAEEVLQKLKRIESGEKSRSISRWKKKIAKGKSEGLSPLQSLIPLNSLKGNRRSKINPVCKEYLGKYIYEKYATARRLGKKKAYEEYRYFAGIEHPEYPPVTYSTFDRYIVNGDQIRIAQGRGGKRLASANVPPSNIEYRAIRATLPFEQASLDNCLAKIKLKVSDYKNNQYAVQPWLTALVDNYSKAILSIWITLKHPSSRSCGMVLRQCARIHGRLPAEIVVDRGSDFQSTYFYTLLANYGISHVSRPASHSRSGSEVERVFGELNTQWLIYRPGNTVRKYESRSVSSSHSAEKSELMTIREFLKEVLKYIEWRNTKIVGTQEKSPAILLEEGIKKYSCVGRTIKFDDEFIVATAVDSYEYKVDPVRGININGLHYWHNELKNLTSRPGKAEVRFEPENPYCIYVKVNNKWVTCSSTGNLLFLTKDPVSRLSEAIRINDGRVLRDKAKSDADQEIIKFFNTSDHVSNESYKKGQSNKNNNKKIESEKLGSIETLLTDRW